MSKYITKNVVLEEPDFRRVTKLVKEKSLGGKGFSAALRIIIREWAEMQKAQNTEQKQSPPAAG